MKQILDKLDDLWTFLCTILGGLLAFYFIIKFAGSVWELLVGFVLIAPSGRFAWLSLKRFVNGNITDEKLTYKSVNEICYPDKKITEEKFFKRIIKNVVFYLAYGVHALETLGIYGLFMYVAYWLLETDYDIQVGNSEKLSLIVVVFAVVVIALLLLSGLYVIIVHAMSQYTLNLKKDIKLLNDNCEKMAAEIKSLKENSLK